jgi:hypothetical protein
MRPPGNSLQAEIAEIEVRATVGFAGASGLSACADI